MAKILISPRYGAGWSTWNSAEDREFLLKDPTLIAMAERKASEEEVKTYIESKFDNGYFYTGGWRDIQVVNIPDGRQFIVNEYDGYESIQFNTDTNWITA